MRSLAIKVFGKESAIARALLDFDEKPIMVVEIVSSNRRDDYVTKRNEYELTEIPEYWRSEKETGSGVCEPQPGGRI